MRYADASRICLTSGCALGVRVYMTWDAQYNAVDIVRVCRVLPETCWRFRHQSYPQKSKHDHVPT